MKKIKRMAYGLIAAVQLCGTAYASGSGALISGGGFEDGIDGFGIAYSSKADTTMPYIFHSAEVSSDGSGSLQFTASKTLLSKSSTSPQSMGFAYQGIYAMEDIPVSEGNDYTASADLYTEDNNIRMRFVIMDKNRAVAASPEFKLQTGEWQSFSYKWTSDITTDNCRVRIAFYNISKNNTVYVDNFSYNTNYITDASWLPMDGETVTTDENGVSFEDTASAFKNYCGVYSLVDIGNFEDPNREYILCGTLETNIPNAYAYIGAENILNTFSEYNLTAGEKVPVVLRFVPSECSGSAVKLTVLTSADSAGKVTLSDFDIYDSKTQMKIEQKDDKLYVSGSLRRGNENAALDISAGGTEMTRYSDGNGDYTFTSDVSVEKSGSVNITISNLKGYDDMDGKITGYAEVYSSSYRESIAKAADSETTVSGLESVLTDDVLRDTGLAKIKNFRTADKDFVFNYLKDCDISTFEKLETELNNAAIIYRLNRREISLIDTISVYGDRLGITSLPIYKAEYSNSNLDNLEKLFAESTTEITTADELHFAFTEVMVKEKIGKSVNYSDAMSTVSKYADALNLKLSGYNALTAQSKHTVANEFVSYLKTVNTYTDIQKKLDALVSAQTATSGGGNSGGSSGGSGGSGGSGSAGGGKYETVDIAPITPNNTSSSEIFTDLGGVEWAKTSIYKLVEKGVVSKSEDKKFRPDANITRAEFTKLAATAFGLKTEENVTVFSDVSASDWYAPYVSALYENGIVRGISDDYFGAGEPVTRQDICTILARLKAADGEYTETTLSDIDEVADYAKAAVIYMNSLGYVNGYEDGTFRPRNLASRAEAAKLICGMIEK